MATKRKALKKSKLRHAEYYDFQSIQDKLYANSKNGKTFHNLASVIALPENIRLAYRNIKKNKGSKTAGTDNRTIKDLEKFSDEQLIAIVQRKLNWYVPQSIRRVEIPKNSDPTKTRPLGIPTIMDRLIQQCVLQVLEPICEAKFHEHSYGFRPNRSQEHAVAQVCKNIQLTKLHYVVDIDIKSFFDRVNHGKLLKQLWAMGIRDKKLLCIISAMLKSEVAGIGFPEVGTPQGGIISPLLSNVVLNELDWWLASQWEEFPTKHQYYEYQHANGSKGRGTKFTSLRKYTSLKEISSVRYADDFKIFTSSYQNAIKLFHATENWLKDRLGLDISPEKSKVINLREQYSEFLGFKFKAALSGKEKSGKPRYVARSHVGEKAIENIQTNLKRLIHNIEFAGQGKRSEFAELCRHNAYVIGIHEYYDIATMVNRDLKPLAFQVHKSLKARLRERVKSAKEVKKKKLPCRTPKFIQERYGESGQLKYIGGCAMIPIGYVQHKNPINKPRDTNSYTSEGRAAIHRNLNRIDMNILHYLMRNPIRYRSIEYNDNRLSLYSAQKGKCAITGKVMIPHEIHCHHKVPRHVGGTDAYGNLVLVSETAHRLIHATNPQTIAKYMEILNLNSKQLKTLNALRSLVNVESC